MLNFKKEKKAKQYKIFKNIFFGQLFLPFYIFSLFVFINKLVLIFFGLEYELSASIVSYLLPSMIGLIIHKLVITLL